MADPDHPDRDNTAGQESASDAALAAAVRRAQAGDEDAFREIYRSVQPRLLNYLRAMVGEADAEDIASEAWGRIARDLAKFRGSAEGFRGWAATIARHRAIDHLRRHPPQHPLPVEELHHLPAADNTEGEVAESISTLAALSAIAALPPDQAQAILLRVVIGLDSVAAGRVLGKRPGAVRTAAHRGLRALARRLNSLDSATQSMDPTIAGGSGDHRTTTWDPRKEVQ